MKTGPSRDLETYVTNGTCICSVIRKILGDIYIEVISWLSNTYLRFAAEACGRLACALSFWRTQGGHGDNGGRGASARKKNFPSDVALLGTRSFALRQLD